MKYSSEVWWFFWILGVLWVPLLVVFAYMKATITTIGFVIVPLSCYALSWYCERKLKRRGKFWYIAISEDANGKLKVGEVQEFV